MIMFFRPTLARVFPTVGAVIMYAIWNILCPKLSYETYASTTATSQATISYSSSATIGKKAARFMYKVWRKQIEMMRDEMTMSFSLRLPVSAPWLPILSTFL